MAGWRVGLELDVEIVVEMDVFGGVVVGGGLDGEKLGLGC